MTDHIIKNKKGGTALFMTVLILTSVLTVTLAASEIVRIGLLMGRTQVYSTKAYFGAEAGAERILWEIRRAAPPYDINTDCDDGMGGYFDTICFDSGTGDIVDCDSSCAGGETDTLTLSNNAGYKLRYKYEVGPPATTTITSIGSYTDIGRAVELKY